MAKFFTLFFMYLFLSMHISYAQTGNQLGEAGLFSVLASSHISNTGTTSIAGNVGINPGDQINDPENGLVISGAKELGTPTAARAQEDAKQAFATLSGMPVTRVLNNEIGNREILLPGVYRINSDAVLKNVLILDGAGNLNSQFIFIIDGNFTSASPSSPDISSGGVLPQNGAQAQNIFWVVKGKADIGESSLLMGSILAQESITLRANASLIGSAMSLTENVSLNNNNIYLTNIIYANLSVTKVAQPADGGFTVGAEVTYVITAKNGGPGTAANVRVQEQFPGSLAYVSGTPSKGVYNEVTNEWTVGELGAGEEATLTIVFRILAAGNLVNNVQIVSDTPDPDPVDNEVEEPIDAACTPPTLAITGDAAICPGVTSLNYTVTEVEGATYSYEVTGGLSILSQSGNEVVVGPGTSLTGGSLTVTVTDQCDNTYTVTQTISLQGTPVTPSITGPATICTDTETTYTATEVSGNVTYNWSATGGLEVVRSTGNTVVVRGSAQGVLSVTITNSCLLTSLPATKAITTTAPLAALGNVSGPATVCVGNEATFSVPALAADAQYTWDYTGNWQVLEEETRDGRRTIRVRFGAASTGGTVTLTATNGCGSTSSTPLAVSVSPGAPATPGVISASEAACVGEEAVYSISPVPNAASYVWSVSGTGWQLTGNTTGTSVTAIAGSGAGTISVRAVNGCGESSVRVLNVSAPEPLGTVEAIAGPETVCAGTTGLQYTVSAVTGATTYTWSVPTTWTITAGQGTNTVTVTAGEGSGAVSVAVANACETGEATLSVTSVAPVAADVITDNSNICDGLVYSINPVDGASSYTWSVPSGFTILSGQGTTSIQVQADSPNAFGDVAVVANNGICDGPTVTAAIDLTLINGTLAFPKAFSPNGDGINDNWEISNITKYPNQITLFNRWGSEVYRKANYQNDWNGNGLEAGTYFYKVSVQQCDNTTREYTGYVMIFR